MADVTGGNETRNFDITRSLRFQFGKLLIVKKNERSAFNFVRFANILRPNLLARFLVHHVLFYAGFGLRLEDVEVNGFVLGRRIKFYRYGRCTDLDLTGPDCTGWHT